MFWHTKHQGVAIQRAREAGAQICDDTLAPRATHVIAEVQMSLSDLVPVKHVCILPVHAMKLCIVITSVCMCM